MFFCAIPPPPSRRRRRPDARGCFLEPPVVPCLAPPLFFFFVGSFDRSVLRISLVCPPPGLPAWFVFGGLIGPKTHARITSFHLPAVSACRLPHPCPPLHPRLALPCPALSRQQDSGVLRAEEFSPLEWDSNPSRAQLADVLRVHDLKYVEKIGKCSIWLTYLGRYFLGVLFCCCMGDDVAGCLSPKKELGVGIDWSYPRPCAT